MVTWELRGLGGSPKVPETQDVPDFDYAGFAEKLGFLGRRIEQQDDVVPVLDAVLTADRSVVIDVRADPNVVALPPHATWEQTTNFFAALAKGDPDRDAVPKQLLRQLAL